MFLGFWKLLCTAHPLLCKRISVKLYSSLIEKCLTNSWTWFAYAVISFPFNFFFLMLLLGFFYASYFTTKMDQCHKKDVHAATFEPSLDLRSSLPPEAPRALTSSLHIWWHPVASSNLDFTNMLRKQRSGWYVQWRCATKRILGSSKVPHSQDIA